MRNGAFMLDGLIWLAPFETKSICPQTRVAVLEFDGKRRTRLLPVSAMKTLPLGSVLTSLGPERPAAEDWGKELTLAEAEVKSTCPNTCLAAAPEELSRLKTRTLLSADDATYTSFPEIAR